MIRYLILIVVIGIAGAIIAKPKGRNQLVWFLLCAFVPLLLIAIALLPSLVTRGVPKQCPHCAEIIKEDAAICKYCGMGV